MTDKNYRFYGWEYGDLKADDKDVFDGDLRKMYDILSECWKADTCAPRMRADWAEDNMTLGQCSITAFLIQDIFGGEVYGVPLGDGNFHCFNVIKDKIYDLTSEQFDHLLDYTLDYPQFRETHFAKKEKEERYILLKQRFKEKQKS